MTNPNNQQSQQSKLELARKVLEDYQQHGGDLFDSALEEEKAKVRRRALLLLEQRGRSCYELKQRLLALEFPENIIDLVIDDLKRCHLLDDAQFAIEWVKQRHERRSKTRVVLDQELKEKGIGAALRAQALEHIDDESEFEKARALAAKKLRTVRTVPHDYAEKEKILRRVIGMLARRGFPQSMSYRVAQEALAERLEEL
ncbi:recombination regulator RecX [Corynebacterium sp. HS2168-gen11]|nr:regulatory protein RecX [Corynebacterium sp. HS2168-gen11]MCS4536351.1 recombination regulator RecX [Corynebacterium sp. HS2168-gen11]